MTPWSVTVMYDAIVFVTEDLKVRAEGKLRNGEEVHIVCRARNHLANVAETGDITGIYFRCNVLPNEMGKQPWRTVEIHREALATGEDFNASTPPTIKDVPCDSNGSNGNGKKSERTPGTIAVNEVFCYLVSGKNDQKEDLSSLEARGRVARELLDQGVDPADNFSAKLENRIRQLKDEQREQARFEVAAALRDPEIIELILAHDGTIPATDDSDEENPYETIEPAAVAVAAG